MHARSSLLQLAAFPRGGLTPAEAPLIDAEILFRQPQPPQTSGSSIIVSIQNTDVDIGLRYGPRSSALPIIPQSVSRGARFSRLRWFVTATACQVAGPPVRI